MDGRFSRQAVKDVIQRRIDFLEREHGLTRDTGWNQVKNKSLAANRAYGAYDALHSLLDEIES